MIGVRIPAVRAAVLLLALAGCDDEPVGPRVVPYDYQVYTPEAYAEDDRAWPAILFLHGSGGLQTPHNPVSRYGMAQQDFPFLVFAPYSGGRWNVDNLDATVAVILARFRVDPERMYVTGLSMGAYGTWGYGRFYGRRVAAMVLVAGGGEPENACLLKEMPIRLYHNEADPVVPVSESIQLYDALVACGSDTAWLTVYDTPAPGTDPHDAWSAAYSDPALYDWLAGQRR